MDKIKGKIANLEKQRNEVDAKLSKLCQPDAEKQKIRQKTSVSNVAKNLPPHSALLEFIRLPKIDISQPFVDHDVVFIVLPDDILRLLILGHRMLLTMP